MSAAELGLVAVIIIGIPLAMVLFFGWFSARGETPLVFQCRRCGRAFHQAPHRRFPRRCAECDAADWNG